MLYCYLYHISERSVNQSVFRSDATKFLVIFIEKTLIVLFGWFLHYQFWTYLLFFLVDLASKNNICINSFVSCGLLQAASLLILLIVLLKWNWDLLLFMLNIWLCQKFTKAESYWKIEYGDRTQIHKKVERVINSLTKDFSPKSENETRRK